MEADWEIEIGGDAPVIDPHWDGFVDLRLRPEAAYHLPECAELPALPDVLIQLNSAASPIWTAKCDLWTVDEFDQYEMDASPESTYAFACYIDLIPYANGGLRWSTTDEIIDCCKMLCRLLQAVPLKSMCLKNEFFGSAAGGRVDLVIRRALLSNEKQTHAVTAYFTGCGVSEIEANQMLSAVLRAFAQTLCSTISLSTLK